MSDLQHLSAAGCGLLLRFDPAQRLGRADDRDVLIVVEGEQIGIAGAEMRYDGHDRQNRWVFPSKTVAGTVNENDYESYTYDDAGNRLSFRKRDGQTLTYQYDGLNRVTLKTVPSSASGAAAGYSVSYGYDVQNLQLFARNDPSAKCTLISCPR